MVAMTLTAGVLYRPATRGVQLERGQLFHLTPLIQGVCVFQPFQQRPSEGN